MSLIDSGNGTPYQSHIFYVFSRTDFLFFRDLHAANRKLCYLVNYHSGEPVLSRAREKQLCTHNNFFKV